MHSGDHPRIRGEKLKVPNVEVPELGSPPHTRGKGFMSSKWKPSIRITPAYAGKSTSIEGVSEWRRDHPRIRGEKWAVRVLLTAPLGSPPHTRGKDVTCLLPIPERRITPAYAGKRLKESRNYAVFGLPVSAIRSVCDRAQAPGNSLATPCGRIVAPEKDDQPGLQVYSQRHHPPCAGPDQADRGSG